MTEDPEPEGGEKRISAGRREYDDPNRLLNEHIENNDERLRKVFKGGLIVLTIIGLAVTVSLIGFGFTLRAQQNTADQLEKLVKSNQDFAKEIQDQRRESILSSCRAQNARNSATKNALTAGSDEDIRNAPTVAAREEVERRRDVTLALIDALAPPEDCDEAVKRAVQGG